MNLSILFIYVYEVMPQSCPHLRQFSCVKVAHHTNIHATFSLATPSFDSLEGHQSILKVILSDTMAFWSADIVTSSVWIVLAEAALTKL